MLNANLLGWLACPVAIIGSLLATYRIALAQLEGGYRTTGHVIQEHTHLPPQHVVADAESLVIQSIVVGPNETIDEPDDIDLSAWKDAKKLKSLSVNSSKITDQGVQAIGGIRTLEYVNLHGCAISDKSLSVIAKLPRLQHLDVSETPVTVAGLRALEASKALRVLNVASTDVGDEIFTVLRKLQLESVDLSYTKITDRGTPGLGLCVELKVVDLSGTRVSADSFETLGRMKQLSELVVPLSAKEAVSELRRRLPNTKIYSY